MAMDESFWANQKYNEYDLIILCVGFVPAPLPEIRAETQGTPITFQYDPSTAALNVKANIYECGMSQPEYFTAPVEGLGEYPSPAVGGGEETGVEGWRGERLVSWLLFRTRAKQIVRNIVEHEKKFCTGSIWWQLKEAKIEESEAIHTTLLDLPGYPSISCRKKIKYESYVIFFIL